ncbi:MAG: nitroreductase family protein [Dehalococcoidia bacterium]|nr:nitroreductase family protein [Dehalococcoidia bacterium]
MQIDDFLELARKRRSIRRFKPDPVPEEYLNKILEAARWAMSGANSQPWEFIVIKDKVTIGKMAEAFLHYAKMQTLVELTRLPEYGHPKLARKQPSEELWRDAPVIIAVLGDMRAMQASTITHRFYEQHTFDHNMANAVNMMQLAAAALGLGAQWVSLDPPRKESLKLILGVPPELTLFSLVPTGYPAHQPTGYRRELREMVHYEKYDMSRLRSQEDIQEFIKYLRRRDKELAAFPDKT